MVGAARVKVRAEVRYEVGRSKGDEDSFVSEDEGVAC